MSIRIAVDATALSSGLGGDETLVASLLAGLVAGARAGTHLFVLAADGAELGELGSTAGLSVTVRRTVRRPGPWHFAVTLPRWLASLRRDGLGPDLVLTNTHAPLRARCPRVLLVPDLSFEAHPEHYPAPTVARLRTLVRRQVRQVAAVVTISEFSRGELVRRYGLARDAVGVVPLVPAAVTAPAPDALERLGVSPEFLLYLGNLHPRKNVAMLIRAYGRARETDGGLSRTQLVVAGGRWFSGGDEERAAADLPPGAVLFTGRVSDADREALLRRATALAYLSTYEGFGLPPLEAMLRGTPVLASSTTAIGEVCAGAALLVDPDDEEAVAAGIGTLLTDGALRATLAEAGRARAARYDADATGAALWSVLDTVLAPAATLAR